MADRFRRADRVAVTIGATEYRVYDATEHEGRTLVANPPVPWATFRIFVAYMGWKDRYYFRSEADRVLDQHTLERQFAEREREAPVVKATSR